MDWEQPPTLAEIWASFGLELNSRGQPYPNASNVKLILDAHIVYKGRVWFDSFHVRMRTFGRDWTDADEVELLMFCQRFLGMPTLRIEAVRQAVAHVALRTPRSEPLEWFEKLAWDRTPRLDSVMTRCFGADDTDYAIAVGSNTFKAIAARAKWPGCKVDWMPVWEGTQGTFKSSAAEIIGGPWYANLHSAFTEKDAVMEIIGKLVVEVAELHSVSRRDADRVKQFQSRRVDRIRPPYGRNAIDVPRQCVFIGTTNEVQYLRDPTGARRFMPIRCGRVDLQWLKENREQLLAEAWQRLQDGEGWWEFPETEALAEQEERYEGDPWEEPIDRFLALNQAVTIADVLRDAVKLEVSRQDKAAQMRAATVLARLGWRKAHAGPAGRRRRVWMKAEDVHHQGGALEGKVVQLKTASDQSGAPREPPAPPVQEDRNNT